MPFSNKEKAKIYAKEYYSVIVGTKKCEKCKKEFSITRKHPNQRFCSISCSHIKLKEFECPICKRKFRKRFGAKHCSKQCRNKAKQIIKKCVTCKKQYTVPIHRKQTSNYCSKICAYIGRKKDKSIPFGISQSHHGYLTTRINGKQVYLHRVIMENEIKRKLKKTEVVHHKDGNKSNNTIENLEIYTSNGVHRKEHLQEKDQKRDLLGRFKK